MRLLSAIGIAVLSLTIVAPVYAQQEQQDQKEEEKAKPEQEKEKKAQPEKPAKPEEKSAQEENTPQPQDKNDKQEEKSAQPAQRAGNGGGRIPEDRYQANFGREHSFRVSEGDYRNHRFQYGGYTFGFVGGWPSNWLYTQNVYVMEINGVYYLCNPTYPGVNVALEVTL